MRRLLLVNLFTSCAALSISTFCPTAQRQVCPLLLTRIRPQIFTCRRASLTSHGRQNLTNVTIISGLINHGIDQLVGQQKRQAMHTKAVKMCSAVAGGEQAPDQDGSGLGSDSQPPPGQDPLERDLGGDSWDQGSGNEGQQQQLFTSSCACAFMQQQCVQQKFGLQLSMCCSKNAH